MSTLDFVLLFFLLLGLYRGFKNGLIVELASMATLLLALFIAVKFSCATETFLETTFSWHTKFPGFVAFALTFILAVILISILAKVLTQAASIASLGLLNKSLGAILGFLRNAIMIGILFSFCQAINLKSGFLKDTLQSSVILESVESHFSELHQLRQILQDEISPGPQ